MERFSQIISDEQFKKLQVPVIPEELIGEPLFHLFQIKALYLDLDILYLPNYYRVAFLTAIELN